jgi:hypothetical protein
VVDHTNQNIQHTQSRSTVTFLALSISTCPGNSSYKMQVTGSGSGLLNRASMRTFPLRSRLICSLSAYLSGVRSKPKM